MRDTNAGRRSSHLDITNNISHHNRPSLDARGTCSRPRTGQYESQRRPPREISPPPIKRQRTTYEQSHRREHTSSSTGPTEEHHAQKDQNYNNSSMRKALSPAKQLSKPQLSCKPVCRVCDKTTATSYNPIIVCPGCARSYHDSCRKPPMVPGVDPQRWRCSTCLNDTGKHMKPVLSLKPHLFRHSIVRDIFKPGGLQSTAANSSGPSKAISFGGHVNANAFGASTSYSGRLESLNKPKDVFEPSLQSEPAQFDSPKVSHTPTHCLGQTDNSDSSSQQGYNRAQNGVVAHDSSAALQKRASIALCSVCQKQSILARPDDANPQCQACRMKSYVEETEQLEIPETPDAIAHHNTQIITSSPGVTRIMDSMAVSPVPEVKPSPWFDPSRVTLKPKIRMVGDGKTSYTSTASCQDLQPNATANVFSVPQKVTQKPSSQVVEARQTSPLSHVSIQSPHQGRRYQKDDRDVLRTAVVTPRDEPPISVPPVLCRVKDVQAHSPLQQPHPAQDDHAVMHMPSYGQRNLESMMLKGSLKPLHSLAPSGNSIGPIANDKTLSICRKRHTNRELARIALACAGGPGMTALQIIDWLAQRFPCLQRGQGNWEKSVKTTLSMYEEFCGHRAGGSHETGVLYSLAKTVDKARYEREWRDHMSKYSRQDQEHENQHQVFAEPSIHPDRTIRRMPDRQSKPRLRKAIKSAPTRHVKSTQENCLVRVSHLGSSVRPPTVQDSSSIVSPVNAIPHKNSLLDPFKPRKSSSSRERIGFASRVKHGTSFHDVYACSTQRSIEMMSSEEKAEQAADIRTRPTRKELINSDQRLAHVRRFRRQDIHDESDGAWMLEKIAGRGKANQWEDGPMRSDYDGSRSLLEMFNLPANAVPMNDGMELAFRDGTLINGRLPRPRVTYRVGRRLGAGLTVN